MASVCIIMGSKSDEEKVAPCAEVLKKLGISFFMTVSSAHRTPERTEKIVREQEASGCRVFICAAGMASHLAGAVAARTTVPVIGILISGTAFGGMDSLLSIVQMPKGIPVATVAIDGADNAAILAAQMIALSDDALAQKLAQFKADMAAEVTAKDEKVRAQFA